MTIHCLNELRGNRRTTLAVLAGTHALVDACCAALVFSLVHVYPLGSGEYLKMIVGYNLLAFAMQPLCGLLVDHRLPAQSGAVAGILFTVVAGAAFLHHPWLTVTFAGLGNAFFHVGGGVAVLTMKKDRAAPSGIFVAPGAVGLVGGALIGGRGVPPLLWGGILLVIAAVAVATVGFPEKDSRSVRRGTVTSGSPSAAVILLLLSVAGRSFIGFSAGSLWQGHRSVLIVLAIAAACGKAMGGVAADRLGWMKTSIAALLLCAISFICGTGHVWGSVAALLLLQMTMPVTLAAVYKVVPGQPGLTFGLCCLALIAGAVPVFTRYAALLQNGTVLLSGIIISTITLFAGLRMLSVRDEGRSIMEDGATGAGQTLLLE